MLATTAGTSILPLQAWVKSNLGEWGWEKILMRVPAEHAHELRGILLAQKKYPTVAFVAAIEAAGELDGSPDFFERYGEWAAHYTINAFFRFLLRFKSPGWVVSRSARVWHSFHSSGEWTVEVDEGARRARRFCRGQRQLLPGGGGVVVRRRKIDRCPEPARRASAVPGARRADVRVRW